MLTIDLLYGDSDGGQRVVSRMMLQRGAEGTPQRGNEAEPWIASVVRHWNLDRADPR